MTNIAKLLTEHGNLTAEVKQLQKDKAELKKKRTKGEINEAYAKTIEANKDEISKLKIKVNKLEQKLANQHNSIGEDDEHK